MTRPRANVVRGQMRFRRFATRGSFTPRGSQGRAEECSLLFIATGPTKRVAPAKLRRSPGETGAAVDDLIFERAKPPLSFSRMGGLAQINPLRPRRTRVRII